PITEPPKELARVVAADIAAQPEHRQPVLARPLLGRLHQAAANADPPIPGVHHDAADFRERRQLDKHLNEYVDPSNDNIRRDHRHVNLAIAQRTNLFDALADLAFGLIVAELRRQCGDRADIAALSRAYDHAVRRS